MTSSSHARRRTITLNSLLRYWVPVLLWTVLIAVASGSTFSGQNTVGVFAAVVNWLAPGLTPEQVDFLHRAARKSMHVLAYGVGAVLWFRAVYSGGRSQTRHALVAAFVVTLVIAAADEFRQSRFAERSGRAADLIFDGAGALAALLIIALLVLRRSSRKDAPTT